MKNTKSRRTEKQPVGGAAEDAQPTGADSHPGNASPGKSVPADTPEAHAQNSDTNEAAVDQPQEESVESLRVRVSELEESYLRAKADCRNVQRRATIERADAIVYANAGLMRSLLGVLDDLERSLAAAPSDEKTASWIEGIELLHANFLKALTDSGLQPIEALHQPFDPNVHEAMMQQPSDEFAPGTVLKEVAKGYRMKDKVIRPAKVIVSTAVQEADSPPIDETA